MSTSADVDIVRNVLAWRSKLSRLARYRTAMTQKSLTNRVFVISSPAHAGCLSGSTLKGHPATCGWSLVSSVQCAVSSHYNSGHPCISEKNLPSINLLLIFQPSFAQVMLCQLFRGFPSQTRHLTNKIALRPSHVMTLF